jgi:S1-C subfamily serine protease
MTGIRIEEVVSGGPSTMGRLRRVDLLVEAYGKAVTNAQSLQRPMLDDAIGQPLALTVVPSEEALIDVVTPEGLRGEG